MKLEIQRSDFWKAWQVASKYTDAKTTMDALNGIRLTASADGTVTLDAMNMKGSVSYTVTGSQIQEAGTAVLNGAIFGEMLKKSNTERITLETTPERGVFTAGNSRMRFAVISADTFPKLPESDEAEAISEIGEAELARIVNEGNGAASVPAEFPKYMGTCLLRTADEMMFAVSTDGRRLAYSRALCDVKAEKDMLLPAPSLKELVKHFTGDGRVRVKANASTVWFLLYGAEYTIRRIDATFPQYEKILNDKVVSTIRVNNEVIMPVLERAAVIAKNNPARLIAISLAEGMEIKARAAGLGTMKEIVEPVAVEGASMSVGFNVNYLLEGLKAAGTGEVLIELSGEEEQARIYRSGSRDFMYMLMPARLTAQDMAEYDESEAIENE